ncbi:KH domain-containing protein [uncultured Desulfovibrio sp.]|uniref:KH domain-containing protein n=1 Tax=uncultured Desulfovibrio sp. TaxID=167968 RepID=UPI0025E5EF05|nr:KH domain-containing protein [uncultured Desulfovibrio sp.]
MMKALIENIARSLVDDPDAVQVREVEGDQATVLELTVSGEDLGKVIGRQGRTARAMRTILGAASIRAGKRTVLEILE